MPRILHKVRKRQRPKERMERIERQVLFQVRAEKAVRKRRVGLVKGQKEGRDKPKLG